MLGAGSEAEDAVQETFLRAWRARDRFAHRSTLKTWLYKIATNVCLDMPQRPQRRARPMDLVPSSTCETAVLTELPEYRWVQPVADARVLPGAGDPAELAAQRDTVRLAFVAALQTLAPRQRAVLIRRDVLHLSAAEVARAAGLERRLGQQRAAARPRRARRARADPARRRLDDDDRELLARYVDTFERYDIEALVELLREDAVSAMPPFELWIEGAEEIDRWMLGPGSDCQRRTAAGDPGQRMPRVRQLPDRSGRRLGRVRTPGPRTASRPDRRRSTISWTRSCWRSSGCRFGWTAERLASTRKESP